MDVITDLLREYPVQPSSRDLHKYVSHHDSSLDTLELTRSIKAKAGFDEHPLSDANRRYNCYHPRRTNRLAHYTS